MEKRRLGRSDLWISPIGIGTWAIGGDRWDWGWGPQDDAQSMAAIKQALDAGINWIDTAPVYGLGHAERIVAEVLRRLERAARPLVFTKCGFLWDADGNLEHRLTPSSIVAEVDASLQRLGIEHIDLCQIHWPSYPPDASDDGIEAAIAQLHDLRKAGKIREIGVCNFSAAQLERAVATAPIAAVQPPYSLVNNLAERDLFPVCRVRSVGVIVYSPLEAGLLTGTMTRERLAALPDTDWRKAKGEEFQEPRLSRNLRVVDALRTVATRRGSTIPSIAIAWVLRHVDVTGAIAGVRRPGQIDAILPALGLELSTDDLRELDQAADMHHMEEDHVT